MLGGQLDSCEIGKWTLNETIEWIRIEILKIAFKRSLFSYINANYWWRSNRLKVDKTQLIFFQKRKS